MSSFTRRGRSMVAPLFLAVLLALPAGIVLASHQFSDVPNSNIFHADIDAVADAGVTTGCAAGRYCPDDNVTRGQMAAFMNRLGALGPGKTPVVNAAELRGLEPSAFHRYGTIAPFGSVQYGFVGISGHATAADEYDAGYASYPVPLAGNPTPHVIGIGDSVPAGCSGTAASPSAEPGHLCIWITYELRTDGTYSVFRDGGFLGASRFGFSVDLHSSDAGNYAMIATWAVGAPGLIILPEPQDVGPRAGQG